ncbi:MAG: DUF5723 family protein [Bacteroidota bacterium]|jgi:hypothetical protein
MKGGTDMKKFRLTYALIFGTCFTAFSQTETTLPYMRGLYQSNFINPAFMPEYQVVVGLPVVNNLGFNAHLVNLDAGMLMDNIDTSGLLDLTGLQKSMKDGNAFGLNFTYNTDLLYIGFPIKGFFVGIGAGTSLNTSIALSKDLINGSIFVRGKDVDFSGSNLQLLSYSNINFSIAKEIRKFTVGARFKYLIGHAYFGINDLAMSTRTGSSVPYPITLKASGSVITSGFPVLLTELGDRTFTDAERSMPSTDKLISEISNNSGWGLDFGLTYQPFTKLELFASVIDFGSITWKHRTYKYELKSVERTFEGFTYTQINSVEERDRYLDSLTNILSAAQFSESPFVTTLPTRLFAGMNYTLGRSDKVGVMFQGQNFPTGFYTAFTANYSHMIGRFWQIVLNYSLYDFNNYGIGFGTTMKLGPFQLFFVQDNVMTMFSPTTARSLYFRTGFNLVYGDTKKRRKVRTDNRETIDSE